MFCKNYFGLYHYSINSFLSRKPEVLFTSQMEAIRHVKHKTLVKLLGCCTEGAYRKWQNIHNATTTTQSCRRPCKTVAPVSLPESKI
ncbi:unnamed protein product [Lupinus luteus]|uniref:Uncharacterized protein n=1 Tax=Lupinus luteus TaxID=3873 RepID=A0AAV1YG54_LUPLU